MANMLSAIYLLNDSREILNVFTNKLSLSAAIINNAEKHPEGYLVNNSLLEHLYNHKVIAMIKEDSEWELKALETVINLIKDRPFTTFLYKERLLNE